MYNNGGCSHTCKSSNGTAMCHCPTGYCLSRNNKTCVSESE